MQSMIGWIEMSSRFRALSQELLATKEVDFSEETIVELGKLGVNSYIFFDYLQDLSKYVQEDEEGYLDLHDKEVENIWKCLLSMSTSKKQLMKSSISLELH